MFFGCFWVFDFFALLIDDICFVGILFFISFFLIFQKFFELVPPSFIRRLILVLVMITSSAWIACLSSVLFLMYSLVRACIVLGGWFWLIALSCSFLAIDFSFLRCFIPSDSLGLFVFLMVMVRMSWVRLFSIVFSRVV